MRKHQKPAVEKTAEVAPVRREEEAPVVLTLEQVPEKAVCRLGIFYLRRITHGTFKIENVLGHSTKYKIGDMYSLIGDNGKVPVTLVGV